MLKARLSTSFPHWPLLRQTPGGKGRWKNVQFHVDQPVKECDVWFVYDGLTKPESVICPPENIVFITGEPPGIKTHRPNWLAQFSHVISCQRNIRHSGLHLSQTALPWHLGKAFDELAKAPFPQKTKKLSAICSNKAMTPGHRRRLSFIQELQRSSTADVFGRGLRPLAEKFDGLADYQYSIAIENSEYPDYWTEKIADAFLVGTVPFYHGCSNISHYFPPEAYVWIDLEDYEKALSKVKEVLQKNDYHTRLPALQKAKELVLQEYNLFNLLAEFCQRLSFNSKRSKIQLTPEPQ